MIRRVDPKLIMLTTIAMTGGRASPAADWSETLDASANAMYATNPQFIAGSHQTDEIGQLMVDGSTTAQTELGLLTVTPRFLLTRYWHESSLDSETGSIDLNYQHKLERGQWTLTGRSATDFTITSELGTTGITNVNQRRYSNTAAIGYQHFATERLSWQVQGSWQDTRYTNAAAYGLTNYSYASAQLGPIWALSERLSASLILGTDRISPQSGTTEKDYSASLQLKRSVTEQYAWRVSAGATRVESQGTSSATSWVAEVGASRQGERVQWDLSAKRAVVPIGVGLLAVENAGTFAMTVGTSQQSSLTLSLSAIRTDPITEFFYLAPGIALTYQPYGGAAWGQVGAEWRYQFSQKWAFTAGGVYARARNYSLPEWANGNQARLGISWQSGRL